MYLVNRSDDGASGLWFKLMANIDLAGHYWVPIGWWTKPFRGNIDGGGFTISNIYIDKVENERGFIGVTSETVTIRNLFLKNVIINCEGYNMGALISAVRYGTTTVENCHVLSGDIRAFASGTDGVRAEAGELIGSVFSTLNMSNSSSAAKVHTRTNKGNDIGGLIGKVHSGGAATIKDCLFRGIVEIQTNNKSAGGLIGWVSKTANIERCVMSGSMVGFDANRAIEQGTGYLIGGIEGPGVVSFKNGMTHYNSDIYVGRRNAGSTLYGENNNICYSVGMGTNMFAYDMNTQTNAAKIWSIADDALRNDLGVYTRKVSREGQITHINNSTASWMYVSNSTVDVAVEASSLYTDSVYIPYFTTTSPHTGTVAYSGNNVYSVELKSGGYNYTLSTTSKAKPHAKELGLELENPFSKKMTFSWKNENQSSLAGVYHLYRKIDDASSWTNITSVASSKL